MAKICKVTAEYFPRVLPLLHLFPDGSKVARQWQRFLAHHWPIDEGYFGYALEDGESTVGFLGLVFSKRIIEGRQVRICNPTSWIVRPEFRRHSLALLSPLLQMKDYTIVNMTPSAGVHPIFRLYGFRELETSLWIFLPRPSFRSFGKRQRVVFGPDQVQPIISQADSQVLEHHRNLGCHHIVLTDGSDYCYLVVTRRKKRRLTIAHIHHVGNLRVFLHCINAAVPSICLRLRVAGVQVDQRLLQGHHPALSLRGTLPNSRLYKSEDLSPGQIDGLYTELVFLNR